MRALTKRELFLSVMAGLLVIVLILKTLMGFESKIHELELLKEKNRTALLEVGRGQLIGQIRAAVMLPADADTILKILADKGSYLATISVSSHGHSISTSFTGSPEDIWELLTALSKVGRIEVERFDLKKVGSSLSGTIEVGIPE